MNQIKCNLQSIIQEIKGFVYPRIEHDEFYSTVKLELEKIANSINTAKPTIEIFSHNKSSSQGLNYFFSNHPELSQYYQLQISDLSIHSTVQTIQNPELLLQANEYFDYQSNCYQLEKQQRYIIGRDSIHDIALPKNKTTSSIHAEVKAVDCDNNTTWVIKDLSRNGTYVNGERIQNPRTLQFGDKITLAYPSSKPKAAEFIFKAHTVNKARINTNTLKIRGDIICLILNSHRPLTESEQALIQQISQRPVFDLIIIQDVLNTSPETLEQANKNLAEVENWIKKSYSNLADDIDIFALPISITYPHFNLPSPNTERFDKFSEPLIHFGANPLSIHQAKPLFQVKRIKAHLKNKLEKINLEKQQQEQLLHNKSLDYWITQKQKAFSRLRYDKEETFGTIYQMLNSSKNDLSFLQLPDSFLQKLDLYIKALEIKVIKENNQICLELVAPNSSNTHQAILQFCQEYLSKWGEQEWSRICNNYADGGFNGFYQRNYNELNCIPGFTLPNLFKQSSESKNWQDIFQQFFVAAEAQQSYRNQLYSFSDFASLGIQGAMAVVYPNIVVGLIMSLTRIVGKTLSYPEIQKYKLEQQTEQLRRTTFNHYQNVARYLLSKITEELISSVKKEDREYRKALESTDELLREHFNELNKAFITDKQQKQHIFQEIAALEKLKQNLAKP